MENYKELITDSAIEKYFFKKIGVQSEKTTLIGKIMAKWMRDTLLPIIQAQQQRIDELEKPVLISGEPLRK